MVAIFACGCRFSGADCGDVDTDGAMEFCPLHEAHRITIEAQRPNPVPRLRAGWSRDEVRQSVQAPACAGSLP